MNFPSSSLSLSPLLRKQQARFHVSWTLKTKPQDDKNRKKIEQLENVHHAERKEYQNVE
jgi:hypothetical protein